MLKARGLVPPTRQAGVGYKMRTRRACPPRREQNGRESAKPGVRAEAPERSARREGGSNSVVESQPSKLLVAGSIPVSRSSLRSHELRARCGWQASEGIRDQNAAGVPAEARDRNAADLSAEAPKARRPM